MDQISLTNALQELGIRVLRTNLRKGCLEFRCPLAPWLHAGGVDKRPGAGAWVNLQGASRWHCLACHSKGTISWLARTLGYFRQEDYSALERKFRETESGNGLDRVHFGGFEDTPFNEPDPIPLVAEVYIGLWPAAWDAEPSRAYLLRRDISRQTSDKIGLMYDPQYQRILFPVRDRQGQLFGFTGRAVNNNPIKVMDYAGLPKRRLILGAERWRQNTPLFLVEGLFAYAHLIEQGVEQYANVGAALGSSVTIEKADMLRMLDAPVYGLFDNDAAGDVGLFGSIDAISKQREQNGLVHRLQGHVPVMLPRWPCWQEDGVYHDKRHEAGQAKMDPDELTADEIQSMVQNTFPYGIPERIV